MSAFHLTHANARRNALEAVRCAPEGWVISIRQPTRSNAANALMWALLTQVSEQVEWYGRRLTPEDWKCIFSAALREQDIVPNLAGTGFVVLGLSTSKLTKREFGDLLDLIGAFCAERGVEVQEVA